MRKWTWLATPVLVSGCLEATRPEAASIRHDPAPWLHSGAVLTLEFASTDWYDCDTTTAEPPVFEPRDVARCDAATEPIRLGADTLRLQGRISTEFGTVTHTSGYPVSLLSGTMEGRLRTCLPPEGLCEDRLVTVPVRVEKVVRVSTSSEEGAFPAPPPHDVTLSFYVSYLDPAGGRRVIQGVRYGIVSGDRAVPGSHIGIPVAPPARPLARERVLEWWMLRDGR